VVSIGFPNSTSPTGGTVTKPDREIMEILAAFDLS